MHKKLADLIEKEGIDMESMSEEEKQTFDQWNLVLTDDTVTPEKMAEFCRRMQSAIEAKWDDKFRDRTQDTYLADMHSIYGVISRMITAKRTEREALEIELQNRLDNKI